MQVWLGDRMHFRVTEFKQALRNEDFESLIFVDGVDGACRMELTVRLSSVYREKMIWQKLTSQAAVDGVANVLDAGAFRALREVLEPLCLYASTHVAFKRTLVAALNHLIFDDGRLVLAEPAVEGPFMDPSLTDAHVVSDQPLQAPAAAAAVEEAVASHSRRAVRPAAARRSTAASQWALPQARTPTADTADWRAYEGHKGQAPQQTQPGAGAPRGKHAHIPSAVSYASLLKRVSK